MSGFKILLTYLDYVRRGREEDFHSAFESALEQARKEYLGKEYPLYIGGKEVYAQGKLVERSPIDGSVVCTCQRGTREEARKAIAAAKEAQREWEDMGYRKRAAIMRRAADIFESRKFLISAILSVENGKNRLESVGEVDEAINFLRYYSYLLTSNSGYNETVRIAGRGARVKYGFQGAVSGTEVIEQRMRPYGVFGVIAPFNFPISISTGMSAGALVTGNTVVFKPSSTGNLTMLTGIMIYQVLRDAGVPDGVFNYVSGPGSEVGDELVVSPDVKGIAFTGSKDTGKSMIRKAYDLGLDKVFIVEMGGKNPAIVSDSADIDGAANGIVSAAFGFAGQKCSALSRLYVHESVKEKLLEAVVRRLEEIKIGNPLERDVYMGPLASEEAYRRYVESVELARRDGRVLYGGRRVDTGLNGYYVMPTIAELKHGHELFRRELFLPFLVVDTYREFSEAIRMANDTEYGLTAALYSGRRSEIEEFKREIEAGVSYINRYVSATTGALVGYHPFVGWKSSGFTGKGAGGRFYLLQFLREQSMSETRPG